MAVELGLSESDEPAIGVASWIRSAAARIGERLGAEHPSGAAKTAAAHGSAACCSPRSRFRFRIS